MAGEQGEPDDLGHLPSMSSKSRELSELQDMYRRALAASWGAQPGELPADECIENIFAGGDGWSKEEDRNTPAVQGKSHEDDGSGSVSDNDHTRMHQPKRSRLGFARRAYSKPASKRERGSKGDRDEIGAASGGASIGQQAQQSKGYKGNRHGHMHEVDELEIREDLRSWQIS